MQGVQDWELASEIMFFVPAESAIDTGQLRALTSYLGTGCNPALSGLDFPSLSFVQRVLFFVQSHQLLGLGHLTFTRSGCNPLPSLFLCMTRSCGLMASLLGTPFAPFSQGRRL